MKSLWNYIGVLAWRLSYSFHSWRYDRSGYGRGGAKKKIQPSTDVTRIPGKLETRTGLLRRDVGQAAPVNVMLQAMRPKRSSAKPTGGVDGSSKPLERTVLKAITQALRLDRRVSRVERNQSGLFQEGNRFIRVGTAGSST
jgi:hypothetical protein